ncbi:hypothetical protein ABPG74_006725, partial [Tetrahymena malaccensis]
MDSQQNIQVQVQSQVQIDTKLSSFLLDNHIQLGKKLGEGLFAEVFEGFDHNLQQKVAIKKLKDLKNLKKFEEEKDTMEKIQNNQYAIQIFRYLHDIKLGYSMIIMEFCDSDLGLSRIIENHELQELIFWKLTNGGNLKYMSPEIAHNIKPFTNKIDVFSIGQILVEFLLQRKLSFSEFLKLKEHNLLDIIPELKKHQNYQFVEEILANMVCYESKQRLKPMKLVQKLNKFQVDVQSLKSLTFSCKNDVKINQDSSQNQLIISNQPAIQLPNTNLSEKKQIKSICITKENMNENLNLENCQVVMLDFNNSLAMQKSSFQIENLNIVNAIGKIQKVKGITTMIIDL